MRKLVIILFLFYPILAYTQGWSISYSIGYGTYQLEDIKSLNEAIPDSYGLKMTDWFPDHITHSVSLGYAAGHHHFGTNLSYLTTGGRLHRADYSGSYRVDMIMNGYRLGAFYRYYIGAGLSPLSLYLQMSPGVLFSNLKMREDVIVYSESVQETTRMKGAGIYLEPTLGVNYRFTDWLHFSFGGGYEFDFPGKMKLSGQKTQIESKWDGLRLYGGIILFYH